MTTEHAAMIAEFHLAQQRRLQRRHPFPSDPPQDPAHPAAIEVAVRVELVDMVAKAMAEVPVRS
jgi:hypothetical protein